jgi:predicted small secreted protein
MTVAELRRRRYPRAVRRMTIAAMLAGAALLAGCGSTDTGAGDEGDGGTRTANDQEVQLAYENGYQQCTGFSLQDLQTTYNAEAATKESIAEAVARSTPGQPELQGPTKLGCTDAIDKKPLRQAGEFDPQGDTNTTE